MEFTYIGGGSLRTYGCPEVIIEKFYHSNFAVGETAFDLISARKGKLEAVVIKKVWFNPRGGVFAVVYRDTLNAIYGESNLCTHEQAVEIATAYLNRKLARTNALIDLLNCQ